MMTIVLSFWKTMQKEVEPETSICSKCWVQKGSKVNFQLERVKCSDPGEWVSNSTKVPFISFLSSAKHCKFATNVSLVLFQMWLSIFLMISPIGNIFWKENNVGSLQPAKTSWWVANAEMIICELKRISKSHTICLKHCIGFFHWLLFWLWSCGLFPFRRILWLNILTSAYRLPTMNRARLSQDFETCSRLFEKYPLLIFPNIRWNLDQIVPFLRIFSFACSISCWSLFPIVLDGLSTNQPCCVRNMRTTAMVAAMLACQCAILSSCSAGSHTCRKYASASCKYLV